jgi:hypothetical protein
MSGTRLTLRGGGLLQGRLKLRYIRNHGAVHQPDGGSIGFDDAPVTFARGLQELPQRGERHAELVARPGEIVIRPEELDQHVALLGPAVVGQVPEERHRLLVGAPLRLLATAKHPNAAKQLNSPHRDHPTAS